MTVLSTLDFEGGSDGAALSESGWTNIGDPAPVYDDAQKYSGSLSAYSPAGSSGWITYNVAAYSEWRLRFYLRLGAATQTGHQFIVNCRNASTAYLADLQLRNEGGGKITNRWDYAWSMEQAATAHTRDEWRRVDYHYTYNTDDTGVVVTVYDSDDTGVDYTLSVSSTSTAVATVGLLCPQDGGVPAWVDDVVLTTGEDPGPYVPPAGPSEGGLLLPSFPTVPSVPTIRGDFRG